jgi:hypothetical protein
MSCEEDEGDEANPLPLLPSEAVVQIVAEETSVATSSRVAARRMSFRQSKRRKPGFQENISAAADGSKNISAAARAEKRELNEETSEKQAFKPSNKKSVSPGKGLSLALQVVHADTDNGSGGIGEKAKEEKLGQKTDISSRNLLPVSAVSFPEIGKRRTSRTNKSRSCEEGVTSASSPNLQAFGSRINLRWSKSLAEEISSLSYIDASDEVNLVGGGNMGVGGGRGWSGEQSESNLETVVESRLRGSPTPSAGTGTTTGTSASTTSAGLSLSSDDSVCQMALRRKRKRKKRRRKAHEDDEDDDDDGSVLPSSTAVSLYREYCHSPDGGLIEDDVFLEIAQDFGDVIVPGGMAAAADAKVLLPPPPPPEGFQDETLSAPSSGGGGKSMKADDSNVMCTPPIRMTMSESRATLAAAEDEDEEDEETLTVTVTESDKGQGEDSEQDKSRVEVKVEATMTF